MTAETRQIVLSLSLKIIQDEVEVEIRQNSTTGTYAPKLKSMKAENGQINEALFTLIESMVTETIAPEMMFFTNVHITRQFLETLDHLVSKHFLIGLFITYCHFELTTKDFESFLMGRKINCLSLSLNTASGEIIYDEMLFAFKEIIRIYNFSSPEFTRCPNVTDSFLNFLTQDIYPSEIEFFGIITSFTMQGLTRLIQYVFTNEKMRFVDWNLGILECSEEDQMLIVHLQKMRNVSVESNGQTYTFYKRKITKRFLSARYLVNTDSEDELDQHPNKSVSFKCLFN